jgi:septin family protein
MIFRNTTPWHNRRTLKDMWNLPISQIMYTEKSVKRMFEFTIMVLGEFGLEKSLLIKSLFFIHLYSLEYSNPFHRVKKTVHTGKSNFNQRRQCSIPAHNTLGTENAVDNSDWLCQ